jgi:hypothetical protein
MPKSNFVQNSFVSGELSDVIKSRTDLDQYYKGVQTAANVLTAPQGGIKRRMGSEFIDTPQGTISRMTSEDGGQTFSGSNASNLSYMTDGSLLTTASFDNIGTTDGYVAWELELGADNNSQFGFIDILGIQFIDLTQTPLVPSEDESTEFLLESSSDGVTWGADDTVNTQQSITVPKITNFYQSFRLKIDTPLDDSGAPTNFYRRYWRLVRRGTSQITDTLWIREVNFQKVSYTSFDEDFKIHKFEVSKADSFLLFFTESNLRIYRVTDTATTYMQDIDHGLGANFPNRVAANENVLLLFNKNVEPRRLIYDYNNDGLFYYDTPEFLNIPTYNFDDRLSPTLVAAEQELIFPTNMDAGYKYQLNINGVLSKEIIYGGDANNDERTATIQALEVNLQEMPVFGESGVSVTRVASRQYKVIMDGQSANDYDPFSGYPTTGTTHPITFLNHVRGTSPKEPIWSSTRGYPNLGVYAQGRLWLGGTRDKPQVLMASEAGDYLNFKVDRGEDYEGFLFTINGSKSAIVDVTGGRGVTVFTEGAEYSITGNTPATLDARQQTQHGSFSENVPTLSIDGVTLFADRNGRSIRQFIYDFKEEGFKSVDLSVLSSHLIESPQDMDAVTSISSDDANYVFIINEDGTAVVLNTLREQDITGYTKFDQIRPAVDASEIQGSTTDFAGVTDKFLQVVSVNNVLHVLVESGADIQTTYKYSLVRLTYDMLMDISLKYEPSSTPDGNGNYHPEYLTGTRHFNGQLVNVVIGNNVQPPRYLNQTTFLIQLSPAERQMNATIQLGRNFVPTVKPMPLNTVLSNGDQTQMALKRINRMNMRVINSAGVNIDGVAVPVREFGDSGDSPLNTSLVTSTGIIEDNNGGNGWDREVVPSITVPNPTPFHLLAIDYEFSS